MNPMSPSTLNPSRAQPRPVRRCAGVQKRKAEVVLRLLRGEALDKLSRETAVAIPRLEECRAQALAGMEQALQAREAADPAHERLDEANRRIGELSMENELLRARCEKNGLFGARRSRP